jgi:hypothetical protein
MRSAMKKAVKGKQQANGADKYVAIIREYGRACYEFLYRHRKGTAVILLATIVFFWPVVIHMGSYSPGGDAMFNAWEMARNQHCILRQHCPVYADANIFFPHKDTMLYSESQLSAAVVTLPFHFLVQNPVFQYNLLTITLFFMSGWCMYLLAKYLSRGRELVSIAAGLVFEFAPFKMASIWHLQNLSIFCLPLAVLLVLKYFDTKRNKFLWFLLPTLLYVFFASWVQMIFMLIALGILLLGLRLSKMVTWRPVLLVALVTAVAALATLPLALQYVKFSKTNHASFSVLDQELYGSSVTDYFIPHNGTLLGKVYYKLRPHAQVNAYNLDSFSYHGVVLYAVGAFVLIAAYLWWRKARTSENQQRLALVLTLAVMALVGFLISLGPFLKIKGSYMYPGLAKGLPVVIPTPYAAVDKFLPQLDFIRAVGRASVLFLFALCCALALFPAQLGRLKLSNKRRRVVMVVVYGLIAVELMPLHMVAMSHVPQTYHMQIPTVYKYVNAHPQIDDIVILQGDDDYPTADQPIAWAANVLWSGYYNRNIFNGYSGYIPPTYFTDYIRMINFDSTTPAMMRSLGIKYVIVNKDLSGSTSKKPQMLASISRAFPKVYEDPHYALFKVAQP